MTFEGTKSYYGSYAETYLVVEEAPSPGQLLEPELAGSTQATKAPLLTTQLIEIVAVVIIAVIAVAGFFIFRQQK